jgi:uncharacterized protein YqeY
MSVTDTLRQDMFEARKAGDTDKANILNMAISTIKNTAIEKGNLSEEQELEILSKEAKKIKDSVEQYTQRGREDLAKKEQSQLEVISTYLPEQKATEDVQAVVDAKISELGASSIKDMGRVMGAVMQELKGQADGSTVKELVEEALK